MQRGDTGRYDAAEKGDGKMLLEVCGTSFHES